MNRFQARRRMAKRRDFVLDRLYGPSARKSCIAALYTGSWLDGRFRTPSIRLRNRLACLSISLRRITIALFALEVERNAGGASVFQSGFLKPLIIRNTSACRFF